MAKPQPTQKDKIEITLFTTDVMNKTYDDLLQLTLDKVKKKQQNPKDDNNHIWFKVTGYPNEKWWRTLVNYGVAFASVGACFTLVKLLVIIYIG